MNRFYGSLPLALLIALALAGASLPLRAQSPKPVQILHTFAGGPDETFPITRLVQGADGSFYGTTSGGVDYDGTVFRFTPNGELITLHRFKGSDGRHPGDALILGSDGNFYGTTSDGGAADQGTVFKLTPSGELTTLYSFTGGSDGYNPASPLLQDGQGNFYGTTYQGGSVDAGTVFKLTSTGELTILHTFTGGGNGSSPRPGLVRDDAGNFYGLTYSGGTASQGTAFRLAPDGTFTLLYSFAGGSEGGSPFAGLVRGSDGNFYGVTAALRGGASTVFRLAPDGGFTTLHRFMDPPEGSHPYAPLVQGTDGNFYGVNFGGGTSGSAGPHSGTVFRISPDGIFNTLYVFSGGTEGGSPQASLVQGRDGNFYGVTSQEAANGNGAIFELFLAPTITSPAQATAALGQPFNYAIKATNNPTRYDAAGLPPGLGLDPATGIISGVPTQLGAFNLNLSATNPGGTATTGLTLTVTDALPVVTLTATTPSVAVGSGGKGVVTINLSAAQSGDLIVNYTIKGSALNGTDYVLLKGSKKIRAGLVSKAIKIKPLGDLGGATKKVSKFTLANGDGYVVGTTAPVKVKIVNGR